MSATRVDEALKLLRTRSAAGLVVAGGAGIWSLAGLAGGPWVGAGAILLALVVLLGKFASQSAAQQRTSSGFLTQKKSTKDLSGRVSELSELSTDLRGEVRQLRERVARVEKRVGSAEERLRRTETQLRLQKSQIGQADQLAREAHQQAADSHSLSREGLRLVRQELSSVERRLPRDRRERIDAEVKGPLVSIAIPGFNRPLELEACLGSIVEQVIALDEDRVEVWVTDDRSTMDEAASIAREFAKRYPFVGFRENSSNLGLERNLLESCAPCSGEYLWLMGNDDLLHADGLATVLADAESRTHDVMLFDRVRIDGRGENELPATKGCLPDDLGAGEQRSYSALLDVAAETGVLSAFGFISTMVVRLKPFLAVDPEPYIGLTMYPHIGVLLEAFSRGRFLVHVVPVVCQRTHTSSEKLAAAAGRGEETFMTGGIERDSQWAGYTLAALLQRAADRAGLDTAAFADIPEGLHREESIVRWMDRNRRAFDAGGGSVAADVAADAERFFASFELGPTPDVDASAT